MKRKLLDYLCCPGCTADLELAVTKAESSGGIEEILEGELACSACARTFRVSGGIPRFVSKELSRAANIYTGAKFSEAWHEFPRFNDSYRRQFFDWIAPIDDAFLKDKLVLEGGCGKGRHARIVAESGASEVVAVDIGNAIEIAYSMVGRHEKVHFVQADLTILPLKPVFDFAFSVGVLHHIDDPYQGFTELAAKIKPDGTVCAWVYGRENNWWLLRIVNPIRIAITSKLRPKVLRLLALFLALPVFTWSKLVARPWAAMTCRFRWLPPLYYQEYMSYISRFDFNEIHHIVYDHLAAPVANYVARHYMETWFIQNGFDDKIIRWHNRNSWTGCASRNPEIMQHLHSNTRSLGQIPPSSRAGELRRI